MKYLSLILAITAALSIGAGMRVEPVVYNVTPMWGAPLGGLAQIGGGKVSFATKLTPGSQILFEDLMPNANWKHPAKYKVVGANGVVLEEIATQLPPANLSMAQVISGKLPKWEPNGIEFNLNDFKGAMRVANPVNHYAILINGHADQRHWNDFSFLYRTLTQIYGFNKSNIIVVDAVNKDRQSDLDGDGTPDIQYASTLEGLKQAMTDLRDRVTSADDLILAVNDHGGTEGDESTIVLYDTEIKASEFAKLFNQLKARKIVSIYEQCFSGGFVRPSIGSKRVAMAAAANNEYSWASKDLNFDEFIYHVIAGFAMQTHRGEAIKSDLNGDGKVSAQEAFAYAVGKDVASESPLLEASNNSGDSADHGLGF